MGLSDVYYLQGINEHSINGPTIDKSCRTCFWDFTATGKPWVDPTGVGAGEVNDKPLFPVLAQFPLNDPFVQQVLCHSVQRNEMAWYLCVFVCVCVCVCVSH